LGFGEMIFSKYIEEGYLVDGWMAVFLNSQAGTFFVADLSYITVKI